MRLICGSYASLGKLQSVSDDLEVNSSPTMCTSSSRVFIRPLR